MKRRIFLTCGAAALAVSAGAGFASTYGDEVVAQLTRQGFKNIKVETTWLGRERIVAERSDGLREIVLNPRTGEILRDSWTSQKDATGTRPIVDEVGSDKSSGGSDNQGSDSSGSGDNSGSGDGSSSGSDGGSDSGSSGGSDGGSDHSGSDSGSDGSGGGDKGDDKGNDN